MQGSYSFMLTGCCWREIATQQPKGSQNLSDEGSETCEVNCVFNIRVFRDASECMWKYRSKQQARSARKQEQDKRGKI